MSDCCVSGCSSQKETNSKLKFYRIPSARQSLNAHKRKLWLQAIQQVNGRTENLRGDVRICSAHFISGEPSRDHNNPDFVPSVFNSTKQNPKRKTKWYMGRRKRRRHGAKDKMEDTTTQPRAGSPADLQSAELTEETETLSPEPMEEETLTEDAEAETKTNTITPQTPLSPNKALPSFGGPASILKLDKKFAVVPLKPVFTPAQGYCCQVCIENFPTLSEFLNHEQEHHRKIQDQESCEQPLISQADFKKLQQVQEPSFPCNICDRSFASSHHLKRHKLLHVKDGRKCNICGVLFCQRHNHVLYLPQTETLVELEEDSSIMEPEISLLEGQESNQIPNPDDKPLSTMTVTLLPTSPQNSPSSSKFSRPLSKTRNPLPPPSHTNVLTEIPLPVLKKSSYAPNQIANYSKGPVQPHFPQGIELPSSLQIFSPKFLTSPFFEVTRNYDYILSKQNDVKKIKEENWEVPLTSLERQSFMSEKEEMMSYLDVVF
ncbi:uncharacterized protein LOC141798831 [Halichoeres trimaculatus]|uniref:uncharacterized protein LOC141798831 n=1 Tax=Halichoeres trimaculatus TaxID=147232 RepID=UPI003D9F3C84